MIVDDIVHSFSLHIATYVKALVVRGKFGICQRSPQIGQICTGCASVEDKNQKCCDRFTVSLQYAGHILNWEILFNHWYPEQPPDFIFGTEEPDFLPDIEEIKSLVNWDPKSANSLIQVIEELLQEYKKYQLSLVNQNSRLQFEYESLVSDNDYTEKDVEVHICRPSPHRFGQVNFFLKLPVDWSKIPEYLSKDLTKEDVAVLITKFASPECGKCTPQLYLSPRLMNALEVSDNLKLPAFPTGTCLMDYAPEVCDMLAKKVKQVAAGFQKRKDYINAFLNVFERCLLEYDQDSYRKISFLMEWHDFSFVLTIQIPANFPQIRPTFLFQSVYHESEGNKPYYMMENEYPYSPRWSAKEMCTRAKTFILKTIGDFQKTSIKEGKFMNTTV